LGGALFCVLVVVTLSGPYAWLYERFASPEHGTTFVVADLVVAFLVVLALTFSALTAILLLTGKAGSLWPTTIVLAIIPLALLYAPLIMRGLPASFSFRGLDAAILTAGLAWSFLLRRLAR
jgi:hypothetical protein